MPPLLRARPPPSPGRRGGQRYGGVVSREILRDLGVDHRAVAREVAADRWDLRGRQTVATRPGPLGHRATLWRAVWEVGQGGPSLDGVTALLAYGLTGFTEELTHVSVAHGWRPQEVTGVRIHHVRRVEGEVVRHGGLPCVRPEIAAVRAAHWARSDRQAALLLCLAVQQRLTTGPRLVAAARVARGRRRRRLVGRLVRDVADGAQSLGELDVAHRCRERGLPEPSRQVVRRDNLRANEVVIDGDVVLRIDLVGLRLAGDRFLDQVERALSAAGRRRHR